MGLPAQIFRLGLNFRHATGPAKRANRLSGVLRIPRAAMGWVRLFADDGYFGGVDFEVGGGGFEGFVGFSAGGSFSRGFDSDGSES